MVIFIKEKIKGRVEPAISAHHGSENPVLGTALDQYSVPGSDAQ